MTNNLKQTQPAAATSTPRYTIDSCGYFDLTNPATSYTLEEVEKVLREMAIWESCMGGYYKKTDTIDGVECIAVVYPIRKLSYLSTRYERRAWPEAIAYSKEHGLPYDTGEWMDDEAWLPLNRLITLMIEDYWADCVRQVGVESAPRSVCLQYDKEF